MNRALEEYCRINNVTVASDASDELISHREGFDKLKGLKGISIKQSFQPIEFLTGFQQENCYEIFAIDENGMEKGKIFECQEKSNLFLRLILSPETRPFQAKIFNYPSRSDFILLKRRFQCTFFCYNRPRLDVILSEGTQKNYLGYINFPCKLSCDYRLEIFGKNRKLKYTILGPCCQLGIICKSLPCESCQKAKFSVIDAARNREITKIKKKSAGFWKAALSEADNFSVVFPEDIGEEDKALLVAATIFLDFSYFENKKVKNVN